MANFFNLDSGKDNEVGLLKQLNENGLNGAIQYLKNQPLLILIGFSMVLLFNLIKLFGFIWFLIKQLRTAKLVLWVMLGLICYIAILTGPLGASRFMVPILPLYLFISLYGISDFVKKKKLFIVPKRQ